MIENLQILLRLYYQPVRALGTMLDCGSLVFAALAAAAPCLALGSLTLLVPVAILFVPACILIIAAWDGRGSPGVALPRDYAPMLACVLMTFAVSHLPIVPVVFLAPQYLVWARGAALAYFAILSAIAVQAVSGATMAHAIGTALGGLILAVGGYFASDSLGGIPYMFASPFALIWLYILLRPNVQAFTGGLHTRQNFRRTLEASTLNPRDADAHYQLGLIYLERRNFAEAIARFQKAVEIDREEADPHYQLGRIAREQGRFQDALQYLTTAYTLNPKLSSGEVLRDLGATNLDLGNTQMALEQLEPYIERREYDPQGLYFLGRVYKALNRPSDARGMLERSVEAALTAPPHLRRQAARWRSLAASELRSLPKARPG